MDRECLVFVADGAKQIMRIYLKMFGELSKLFHMADCVTIPAYSHRMAERREQYFIIDFEFLINFVSVNSSSITEF